MQTHTPTVTLRYFEKLLPLNSVLCRLQDDVNIMGYICKCAAGGQ